MKSKKISKGRLKVNKTKGKRRTTKGKVRKLKTVVLKPVGNSLELIERNIKISIGTQTEET